MHPRFSESLSVIRNAGYIRNFSNIPAAFRRRPSRIRLAAAAATVAGATLFGVAAAAGGAGAPAPAGAITASTYHGVSPAVAAALSGRPADAAAAVTAAAKPAQAAHGTQVTVAVRAKASSQPQQAASTGRHESVKAPAKPKAAPAKPEAAPAKPEAAPARPQAAPARQAQPYRIYDSVSPSSIPAREAAAVYSNGRYSASESQTSHLGHALWIDVTGYNYSASVLDVEPGDATPLQAASWVWHRLRADHNALARVYTFRAQWPAVQASIATLPKWMQERVHWWIADPTGVKHMVPGADATQWYWGPNYDLSVANPGF